MNTSTNNRFFKVLAYIIWITWACLSLITGAFVILILVYLYTLITKEKRFIISTKLQFIMTIWSGFIICFWGIVFVILYQNHNFLADNWAKALINLHHTSMDVIMIIIGAFIMGIPFAVMSIKSLDWSELSPKKEKTSNLEKEDYNSVKEE